MLAWAFASGEPSTTVADPGLQWDEDTPVLGPYALVEKIGCGGMGVIYRAVHRETCAMVALKTVLPQYADNPESLARFRREAETAQSLKHRHTMPILEIGCSEAGVAFYTMPVASGGSLQHLNAKYRGHWRRIAELVAKVARAVHHAHQRGVLHRDIKPGNILFTEDHEPLITDFGLAKPIVDSENLTRSCAVLGTPHYTAPEQSVGRTLELTPAADIYSLGAVLFELLTGRTPFVGNNPLDVLQQVSNKYPVRPRRLAPAVPQALEQICMRCLERVPANRYASAHALANDLERWVDGRAVTPRPTRLRLRSFFGRRSKISAWVVCGIPLIVLLCALQTVAGPTSTRPLIGVAMMIDELVPSDTSGQLARQLTDGLRQNLSESRGFRLQERPEGQTAPGLLSVNPLAFGRSASSQVVLAGHLRQAGDRVHLVIRFIRCDTGETFWKRRIILPPNQTATDLSLVARELSDLLRQSWSDCLAGIIHGGSPPLEEAKIFYTHAMELAAHGSRTDMEAAIELFRRAWTADPRYAQACAMLAFSQWTMGVNFGESDQFASAEKTARIALTLDPDSAAAHRVIASCYLQQARYNEAREEFEAAVELDPESAGCCQSLGGCLKRMGHPAQAIPWLQRAVRIEPAHGSFSATLGEALILCDLDQQAEAAFTRAAEIETERPDAQFDLVALRTWQRRYEQARSLCAAARRRYPDYIYGLNFAAWVEFCDGRLAEAQDYYETLRARNSYQDQWVFYGGINPASALAFIAAQSGSFERSQSLASEALRVDRELLAKYPRNSRILHDVAATYAVVGDVRNAMLYLEQAVAAGWAEHRSTRIDPRFNAITHLPPFETLLESTKPKYKAVAGL